MIEFNRVSKSFHRSAQATVQALRDVSLRIEAGEMVAIRGASGSGKSSLLNILGCLDRPTSGSYSFAGYDISKASDQQLSRLRARKIGFIFQSFHLLPRTTALENVEVRMIYAGGGYSRRQARARAQAALERVGLGQRLGHFPSELSGGEQQRVAVARALMNGPDLILADEPTGNLDSAAGTEVMSLLRSLHEERRTVVLVTHDDAVAAQAQRAIVLKDGVLQAASAQGEAR